MRTQFHGAWMVGVGAFIVGAGLVLAVRVSASSPGETVVRDRLVVHRLDIVDSRGMPRMILASPTPDPVIHGKTEARRFPVSGMVLLDENGQERGGFGVADVPGAAPVLALDHNNFDAIGWKVLPDGTVSFIMNDRRQEGTGKTESTERMQLQLTKDGTPSLQLEDKNSRPRVRLTLNARGAGELVFLDASGKAVRTFSPEEDAPVK